MKKIKIKTQFEKGSLGINGKTYKVEDYICEIDEENFVFIENDKRFKIIYEDENKISNHRGKQK